MDASQIIDELCARYGVSKEFGHRIQPLVVRASQVRPELSERILQMVERSFREEARRQKERLPIKHLDPTEHRILTTVAAVLHSWKPPFWLTPNKGTTGEPDAES